MISDELQVTIKNKTTYIQTLIMLTPVHQQVKAKVSIRHCIMPIESLFGLL